MLIKSMLFIICELYLTVLLKIKILFWLLKKKKKSPKRSAIEENRIYLQNSVDVAGLSHLTEREGSSSPLLSLSFFTHLLPLSSLRGRLAALVMAFPSGILFHFACCTIPPSESIPSPQPTDTLSLPSRKPTTQPRLPGHCYLTCFFFFKVKSR